VTRLLNLSVTLVLIFGLTVVSLDAPAAPFRGAELAVLMGFLLLVANVGGNLATTVGLPRLTGYLVVGIVAGPSVMGIISRDVVEDFRLIDEFALALIALMAGAELKVSQLRPALKTIGLTTASVTVLAWIGVAATVVLLRPLLPFLADEPLSVAFGVALILGVWTANSSPDATVAVIEEMEAKGPLTDVILGVTIVKDLVVIILFTVTLGLVAGLLEPGGTEHGGHMLLLLQEVGGALVVGAGLGWVLSRYLEAREGRVPLAIFLFAYIVVVVADALHVELLLTGAAAGFVVENYSDAGEWLLSGIRSVAVVIFAFFFALAGAGLDLAAVGRFWLAAAVILGARTLFTFAGARVGTGWAGADEQIRSRTWKGLISQGGVSLGLLLVLQEQYPDIGGDLVALGMAVVIGNILIGPVLLKNALSGPREDDDSDRDGPADPALGGDPKKERSPVAVGS
jgi:Kef-type K+ transport system membrane component KefB